jgi:very-short-patch-repair endonuclease
MVIYKSNSPPPPLGVSPSLENGGGRCSGADRVGESPLSMNVRHKLRPIALQRCRELRSRMTIAERILWEELRRKTFGVKFYRQHPLFHDVNGRESFFIADFYCHSERMVIELDGEIHKMRRIEDAERTEILNLLGVRVVRFKNDEVIKDLPRVLRTIKDLCRKETEFPSLPKGGVRGEFDAPVPDRR